MSQPRRSYEGREPAPGGDLRVRPYIPSPELVEAVRIAQLLERPLLLKGEPGCGKTRLAGAVAAELDLPYFEWHVKSTSRARDGLYTYDAVGRLRDAQLVAARLAEPRDDRSYVRFGPLGQAFLAEQPAVVLIDEIDKADIDFPNDLLVELDERRFRIDEIDETKIAKHAPLVVITSNDERDLPDAFLRRCVFHYLEFPGEQQLSTIVRAHFPALKQDLLDAATRRFRELRARMAAEKGEGGKRVGTSELLDWVRVLAARPEDEALRLLAGALPFPGVLLKSWEDHARFAKRAADEGAR
ncbi:AAA family ATPase [Sorangium sp. So ce513]|uniref:AAA family ATPase n=1 Tax=Sorangium sp. So ce513 TaxID=3133315 RepID=UPI003F638B03